MMTIKSEREFSIALLRTKKIDTKRTLILIIKNKNKIIVFLLPWVSITISF